MNEINKTLEKYYSDCFSTHGATARGVDWHHADSLLVHYDKMLAVVRSSAETRRTSLLDVGCGYGGLLDRAKERGLDLAYAGIDLVGGMVEHGRARHPEAEFMRGDILADLADRKFDYVVANGVLTEKLDASLVEFGRFARNMVRKMFELCNVGIAFNMMTTYVNFTAPNLYYQSPGELISFCSAELSTKWRIDHDYNYFDFTMYVYK